MSNCLFVSGLLNGTSGSTLKSYFENEERSGGGTVTCVKVHHSECTGLVYFDDYTGNFRYKIYFYFIFPISLMALKCSVCKI